MIDLLNDLNEPQREAVTTIEGPVMVIAGAGSGKTRALTYRVAYMIQEGIDPFSIIYPMKMSLLYFMRLVIRLEEPSCMTCL